MTGQDIRDHFWKGFNLNTVALLLGFLTTYGIMVSQWNDIQYRQQTLEKWQIEHEDLHSQVRADMAARFASIDAQIRANNTQISEMEQVKYRVTSAEKVGENLDTRISRITESYSSQFADMRTQLASIATQLALANQALLRVERGNLANTPSELSR